VSQIAHAVLFSRDLTTSMMAVSYPPPTMLKVPVNIKAEWKPAPADDQIKKLTFDVRQFRLDRTAVLNVDGSMQYAYWEF
jgi:hypothetical protein